MFIKPFAGNTCELITETGEKYMLEVMELAQEGGINDVPTIRITGYLLRSFVPKSFSPNFLKSKKVIYHDPATIVLWEDGTKTVVKCDPKDVYDPTKGLALCFMKKALGNSSRALNDVLHKEEAAP